MKPEHNDYVVVSNEEGETTIKDRNWSGEEDKRILSPVLDEAKTIHGKHWKI